MERRAEFIYNVSLGAAAVLISQLLFAWKDTVGSTHWWEVVSAFGTVAAVVVSLLIATRADVAKHRESMDIRATVVALITPEIVQFTMLLQFATMLIDDIQEGAVRKSNIGSKCKELDALADQMALGSSEKAFERLTHLDKVQGTAVAAMLGLLPGARSVCKRLAQMADSDRVTQIFFAGHARRTMGNLARYVLVFHGDSPEILLSHSLHVAIEAAEAADQGVSVASSPTSFKQPPPSPRR